MTIRADVSVGEFIDKMTILEIKTVYIKDPLKLQNVNKELKILKETWGKSTYSSDDVSSEFSRLKSVNQKLWNIEDRIREKEKEGKFDSEFIELARSVYVINDERAEIKRKINKNLGSELVEEKSYSDYR